MTMVTDIQKVGRFYRRE